MRIYVILAALSSFLAVSTYYLMVNLNPFLQDRLNDLLAYQGADTRTEVIEVLEGLASRGLLIDYLHPQNSLLVLLLLLLTMGSIFTMLHLLGERIWKRRRYQAPSTGLAIRRAVLICAGVAASIIYLLYAAGWELIILTWLLLIILEVLIFKSLQPAVEKDIKGSLASRQPDDSSPNYSEQGTD
jgi:hypothetical protein